MSGIHLSNKLLDNSLREASLHNSLSDRLESLPLILAGPILRRTENHAVTVWVVLKSACQVTLRVYSTTEGKGANLEQIMLEGSRLTVQLGKYLHVVAVTAESVNHNQLQSGQVYAYDLDFGAQAKNLTIALNTNGYLSAIPISYFDHQLPTFSLPPDDLNNLQIVHGSCRKLHGGGQDALAILDNLIEQNATEANYRPHQLFLTGDQIYGDDVADPLLGALTDAGDILLGWQENLPLNKQSESEYFYQKPTDLKPGQRSDIAKDYGGFTAMLHNKSENAKSHLFSFGEYCAMYIFAWSPVLWPENFPTGMTTQKYIKNAKSWDKEVRELEKISRSLGKVRRALANIPTYMIFDDHDISDDCYINREWCDRVFSKALGRRCVQNGLLAYAVFQAWGNTPEQFQDGRSGEKILEILENWSISQGKDEFAGEEIAKYLGLPYLEPDSNLPQLKLDGDVLILDRNSQALQWHYTVRSSNHEVIVLDTRTWRGYPKDDDIETELPILLSPTAFKQQIEIPFQQSSSSNIEITLVVAPTNLVSLWAIDLIQQWNLDRGQVFHNDVGDSWSLNKVGFNQLLSELFKQRDRIIILSGDIHYSGTVKINYWLRKIIDNSENQQPKILAQLTSSALKNAEWKTYLLNTKIKSLLPELPQEWVGWSQPPQLLEIQFIQQLMRMIEVKITSKSLFIRQLPKFRGNWNIAWKLIAKDKHSLPDWRYRIEWIKRKKVQETPFKLNNTSKELSSKKKVKLTKVIGNFVALLWRNRWLQEGDEVIGYSNISVVGFEWPKNNDDAKAVTQDIYWQAPWQPNSIVYSRYFVPLKLEPLPIADKFLSN